MFAICNKQLPKMLKPKRLNQVAIAKATGVSRATVSLVLRGGQGSSEETKAKVRAAAEKMGYRPNALVRSIRSGKSRTVGVLVPPHDAYWKDICYGIHDRLVEADHLPLFLWDSEHHNETGEQYALRQIHRLLDGWVDGVILWPEFSKHYAQHLHEFERRNIPLVVIDHSVPGFGADVVESNETMIADLIVEHLYSLKHLSYLVVSGPEGLGWADARVLALMSKLARTPDTEAHELRLPFGADLEEEITQKLRQHSSITAIIATTDNIAKKTYQAAHRLGLDIPGELSVIGVGNLAFSSVLSPPLTTIHQNGYAVGQKAAQVELERSSGILTGPPRFYTIPVELIKRGSTDSVPAQRFAGSKSARLSRSDFSASTCPS